MLKKIFIFLLLIVAVLAIAALVTHKKLPDNSRRKPSHYLLPQSESALVRHLLPQAEAHPGLSGIYTLRDGRDAFGVMRFWLGWHWRKRRSTRWMCSITFGMTIFPAVC